MELKNDFGGQPKRNLNDEPLITVAELKSAIAAAKAEYRAHKQAANNDHEDDGA